MNIQKLEGLETEIVGKNCSFFESLDSTSTYAKNHAELLGDGHLIVAREQLSGRGRQGKSFYSPEDGGLYMSIVIETKRQ